MELQMTDEEIVNKFVDEKSAEWSANQYGGCNCPAGNPPCSFCVGGYGLTLTEFLSLALEEEFGPLEEKDPHADYDRAMGVLGDN